MSVSIKNVLSCHDAWDIHGIHYEKVTRIGGVEIISRTSSRANNK